MAGKLRAVAPDEKPAPKRRPMSLVEAVESGSHREKLLATERQIARDLPDVTGPAKAALYRQLLLISKELEALDARAAEDSEGEGASTPDDKWEAV